MKLSVLFLVSLVVVSSLGFSQGGKLRKKFYKETCKSAEDTVKEVTQKHVKANRAVPARLLRMHFHDCFVRGCDASVLLNSTSGNSAERDAIPNRTLLGFDVIEDIKAEVEKKCPGVVSCADILTLATRDSISYAFGIPEWEVLTGRRDGRVSINGEALRNIPAPSFNFTQLKASFANKNLTVHDLVVLSGGHTIGVGHCTGFANRLYNFTGKGDQDPSLDAEYAKVLRSQCPPNDRVNSVDMDPGSANKFDSNYYKILKEHKGLFTSDATLLTNGVASRTVNELTEQSDFLTEFSQSMKRLGAIEVLTGSDGEIRKVCSKINA